MEFKEYRRVGLELTVLNNLLVDHTVGASREYSKSTPQVKHGNRAQKALTALRSELEDLMFLEHPKTCRELGERALHVFYGSTVP